MCERSNVIKISVEVRDLAASFTADVWAESVTQPIDLANACNPSCEIRLLFPIDADTFFARDPAAGVRLVPSEVLQVRG